jgi:hypothetical protein
VKSAALYLLIFAYAGAAAPYSWKPVRIVAGGYIPGLVAHPTEPGLIYARTDIGSVYRWDRDARQWIPLTDFHASARAADGHSCFIGTAPRRRAGPPLPRLFR